MCLSSANYSYLGFMLSFSARIQIIGINPYVLLPVKVLNALFEQAGKDKGPIPVSGKLGGHAYKQTLVKYAGKWRLYLKTPMRPNAGIDTGDMAHFEIEYDPAERKIAMHPKLKAALSKNKEAAKVLKQLPPSRQKEIIRYIANLKTEATVDKNVERAIQFLIGKARFVGRDRA